MVYYGLGLSTSNLGVDDYVAAAINGLIEFPAYGYCIFSLQYLGRRINLSGTMLLGGVACIVSPFLGLLGTLSPFILRRGLVCF